LKDIENERCINNGVGERIESMASLTMEMEVIRYKDLHPNSRN